VRISSISKPQKITRPAINADRTLMLELGLSWRAARGADGQKDVVKGFDMQGRRQPLYGGQRGHAYRGGGLQERQAYVAEQAAMLGGMMRPVLGDESGGLRKQSDGEQQKYEEPSVAMKRARYVGRNGHTINSRYVELRQ
jgi:hypothetical protein